MIEELIKNLKEDESYYISWKANIAVAFQDAASRQGLKGDAIYKIANQGADDFLQLLIRKVEE